MSGGGGGEKREKERERERERERENEGERGCVCLSLLIEKVVKNKKDGSRTGGADSFTFSIFTRGGVFTVHQCLMQLLISE